MKTETRLVDNELLEDRWPQEGDSLFPKTERAIDTFIAGSAISLFQNKMITHDKGISVCPG